jgi:hypothetical protein
MAQFPALLPISVAPHVRSDYLAQIPSKKMGAPTACRSQIEPGLRAGMKLLVGSSVSGTSSICGRARGTSANGAKSALSRPRHDLQERGKLRDHRSLDQPRRAEANCRLKSERRRMIQWNVLHPTPLTGAGSLRPSRKRAPRTKNKAYAERRDKVRRTVRSILGVLLGTLGSGPRLDRHLTPSYIRRIH